MELGNISQLKVYSGALRNCSDEGDRRGVEMFARLICEVAGEKQDKEFYKFDSIMVKRNITKRDKIRARNICRNIENYQTWIDNYSPGAERYNERLDQADKNSWKQD